MWIQSSQFTVIYRATQHTAPELCVTVQKHDINIIDKQKKEIHLFEQTCPCEENIEYWHQDERKKYAHFITDCTG